MKKKIGIGLGIVLAILLVVYIGFAIFFQSHFFFQTTIDGIEAGGCAVGTVEDRVREEIESYALTLIERENATETITADSIQMEPIFNGEIDQLLAGQNGFAWPKSLYQSQELTLAKTVAYDEEALEETIGDLSCMQPANQREPVDATVSPYVSGEGYSLVCADYGTKIDENALMSALEEALDSLTEDLDLAESGCYVQPSVGDDDETLLAMIDQLNRYVSTTVTYEFDDETEVLDGGMISTWLTGQDGEVLVDEEAVLEFVKGLARTYNTAYQPKEFETSYGQTVTISNGFYGWRIDNSAEVEQLLDELPTGEQIVREPVYMQTANSHGEHDYGDSYVEINLTAQHLFLYKDGKKILDTDFVSGNLANGHGTPTGAFGVTYKTTNAVLRGEDYATPVNYWMPFNGDVGMHDATWRGSFGGGIYKTNGSHGCINLPLSAAKTIYQYIDKGYAVMVYTLPGTESPAVQQQDAAYIVDLINSIGYVTLESEPVITTARNLYNALPDTAKGYVTNYDVLVADEAALAQLKAGQAWQPEAPQW